MRPTDDDTERSEFLRDVRAQAGPIAPVERVTAAQLAERDPSRGFGDRVAIVSLGNSLEAHGPALAPDIDDRTGAAVAIAVANQSGARYLGHAPYATDGSPAAPRWCPVVLPVDEFVAKLKAYIGVLLAGAYDDRGRPRPALIVLISGHGGNAAAQALLPKLAVDLGVARIVYRLALVEHPGIDAPVQHAADHEQSVAAALGPAGIDLDAAASANRALANPESRYRVIADHPAWAGMAGFYLFGAEVFEPVRSRYQGVKASVRRVVETATVAADPKVGAELLAHAIHQLTQDVFQEAHDAGIDLPPFAPTVRPRPGPRESG